MKDQSLLSIIVPCFNGESYIHRLLDSILSQTYKQIEVIVVNDGSTDNTKSILDEYIPLFDEKGYRVHYLTQNNQGQAAALNSGLKLARGKYIAWPDSDDFYTTPEALETMIFNLSETDDSYAIVACKMNLHNESNATTQVEEINGSTFTNQFFENTLKATYWIVPGRFVAKAEAIDRVIPNREIFVSRGGQNWQMLLPLTYSYKCSFIDQPLFAYVLRSTSHSREVHQNITKELARLDAHEEILLHTIKSISNMPDIEKKKWNHFVKKRYIKRGLLVSFRSRSVKYYASYLKRLKAFSPKLYLPYLLLALAIKMPFDLFKVYALIKLPGKK